MFYENKVVYNFSSNNPPVDSLEAGETLVIEVNDVFNGQLNRNNKIEEINYDKVNPVTGPFYIHQGIPNTMLQIDILNITLDDKGYGAIVNNLGPLGDKISKSEVFNYTLENTVAKAENFNLIMNPFVSIIGVASQVKGYPTGVPYNHGGKMDCPHLGMGASIYLPIQVKGAYLALGGIKGLQGFGQLAGTGIECSGEVKIKIDVSNKFFLNFPIIKKEKNIKFVFSDITFEKALERGTYETTKFLSQQLNLSFAKAYHLLSVIGNIEIYQLVNPHVSLGISMPSYIFEEKDFFV